MPEVIRIEHTLVPPWETNLTGTMEVEKEGEL